MKKIIVEIAVADPSYAEVNPELILEDALGVALRGWPDGFEFKIIEDPENNIPT